MKKPLEQIPVIKTRSRQLIAGLSTQMSLANNTTGILWGKFGPFRKELNTIIEDRGSYSIQLYDQDFMTTPFLPTTVYTKWAGVVVSENEIIPKGLETMILPEGKWAVFLYKGTPSDFGPFAQYIYQDWLPKSGYELDHRPHFEYMPENYAGSNNPDAEEEVWIPIK